MGELAEAGDERAAEGLRDSLRARPDVWDTMSVSVLEAGTAWRNLMGPNETGDALTRAAIDHEAGRLRRDLLAGSSDPVDRLLAGRIVSCWLAVQYAEARYTQTLQDAASLSLIDLRSRELERANRAFLRAVEGMERVRRLRGPRLAVNVGTMNVAAAIGAGTAAAPLPQGEAVVEVAAMVVDGERAPVPVQKNDTQLP